MTTAAPPPASERDAREVKYLERLRFYYRRTDAHPTVLATVAAWLDTRSWIDRQVVSIRLRDDGCNNRRDSYDLHIPTELLGGIPHHTSPLGDAEDVLIPLTRFPKAHHRHRLSIVDETGRSLSMVNRYTQAALFSVFAATWLRAHWTARSACPFVAVGGSLSAADERLAISILGVVESARVQSQFHLDEIRAQLAEFGDDLKGTDDLLALLMNLVETHIVLVRLRKEHAPGPHILKVAFGQGEPRVVRSRLIVRPRRIWQWPFAAVRTITAYLRLSGPAWDTTPTVLIEDGDFGLAQSKQFEYEASSQLLVVRLRLLGLVTDLSAYPPQSQAPQRDLDALIDRLSRRHANFAREVSQVRSAGGGVVLHGESQGPRRIVGLASRSTGPGERSRFLAVDLALERGALVGGAAIGAVFAAVAVLALACLYLRSLVGADGQAPIEHIDVHGTVPILAAVLSLPLGFLWIGREHPLTARVTRPVRRVLGITIGVLLAVAALLAVVTDGASVRVPAEIVNHFLWLSGGLDQFDVIAWGLVAAVVVAAYAAGRSLTLLTRSRTRANTIEDIILLPSGVPG